MLDVGYTQLTIWRYVYSYVHAFETYAQRQGIMYYSDAWMESRNSREAFQVLVQV